MRKIALFLVAATIATPALARDRYDAPPPRDDARSTMRALSDPRTQVAVAVLLDQLTSAVLDTRVGPMADLAPDSGIRPSDTIGSAAARRDPAFRNKLRVGTFGAVAVAGKAANDADAMTNSIDATAARIERIIDSYRR